ncbi:MAG: alpha/beta hydrolase, partial [Chloroflexia bacterium]|nr:alpha/beta hydrolase [Chloroflexia bacterium]
MRRFLGILVLLGSVLASMAPRSAAAQATPLAAPNAATGDFAGLVDIGDGRRLWLECRGSGGPTVILEAGYRTPAAVWTDDLVQPERPRTMVLPGVARFTRVCAYERPGVTTVVDGEVRPSRSDSVPMPRTAERVVADLHALLRIAGVPGPYVLVGHSFGGLLVRLYAATYPDEVAGMVLVDAASEEIEATLTPAQLAGFLAANAVDPPEVASFADYETIDFGAGFATMAAAEAARPLPPLPLVVLARGRPYGL